MILDAGYEGRKYGASGRSGIPVIEGGENEPDPIRGSFDSPAAL